MKYPVLVHLVFSLFLICIWKNKGNVFLFSFCLWKNVHALICADKRKNPFFPKHSMIFLKSFSQNYPHIPAPRNNNKLLKPLP